MNEWPLLIFTLVLQAAIGGSIALGIYCSRLSKEMDSEKLYQLLKPSLLTLGGMAIVGLAASILHLGSPLNAPKVLLNLGSSWLSREILFTGLFILMILLTVILSMQKKAIHTSFLMVSALFGVVDVYVMSAIYSHTIIAQWTPVNTLVLFYGTTLLLGTALVSALVLPALKEAKTFKAVLLPTFFLMIGALAIQLIVFAVTGSTEGSMMSEFLRWALAVLGVATVAHAVYHRTDDKGKVNRFLVYASFAMILVSEFIGRYLFYSI